MNPVFIRQIEGGTRTPSLPVFVRICNALEMSPEYFLQDELRLGERSCDKEEIIESISKFTPAELKMAKNIIQAMGISFSDKEA